MAGAAPFQTAWDMALAGTGRGLCAYAQLALNPGLVKCATLCRLRQCGAADMLAVIGGSLVMFAVDGPGMALEHICSAPIFANVLAMASIPAVPSARHAESCLMLSECGVLALVSAESVGDRTQLRLAEQSRVATDGEGRSSPRLLRKLAVDPLARAAAAVSWLEYIEITLLGQNRGAGSRLSGRRQHIQVGGAICDAAFLAPSQSETQRILLVAAVMDGQQQSVCLHLYETWAHAACDTSTLVAKLPLPFDMAMPVHLVPLPAFPEHFMLLTENEAVLVSALQILSGDIHLHRQQLPRPDGGDCDLVRSFCVAGTMPIVNSAADEDYHRLRAPLRSPRSGQHVPASPVQPRLAREAQKVYISMQSGVLLRACVAPRPFIALEQIAPVEATRLALGDVMLFLGHHAAHPGSPAGSDAPLAHDHLFISGDCTDNVIVHVTAPSTNDTCHDEPVERMGGGGAEQAPVAPTMRLRSVLANHSPAVDCVLQQDAMYMTYRRAPHGAVQQIQFGHATWLGGVLVEAVGDDSRPTTSPVTRAWSLELHRPTEVDDALRAPCMTDPISCVVLQHAGTNMPVFEDVDGGWRVHEGLREVVAERHLVFAGCCGRDAHGGNTILCVFSDGADVVSLAAHDWRVAQSRCLVAAPVTHAITHGACAVAATGGGWAAVAVQPAKGVSPQETASAKQPRATLRVFRASRDGDGADGEGVLSVDIEHDVSCLRAFPVGGYIFVVVGTYEPGVRVYRVNTESEPASMELFPIDQRLRHAGDASDAFGHDVEIDGAASSAGLYPKAAVSDVYLLVSPDQSFVLAGLRSGLLAWAAVRTSALVATDCGVAADTSAADALTVVDAGTMPVVFSGVRPPPQGPGAPVDDASRAIVCAGSLYVAQIGRRSQLEMTPCTGEDQLPLPVCSAVPLAAGSRGGDVDGHSRPGAVRRGLVDSWRLLVVSSRGGAEIASVAASKQSSFREFPVDGEPRRLVLDRDTGLLLVASAMHPATSCLCALDPVSGQVQTRVQFLPSERVCSLATWYVQGPKMYRYVCVGTAQHSAQRSASGRLLIYSLKQAKRRVRAKAAAPGAPDATGAFELKYVWESERGGPVSALASMGDVFLVVAVGASCVVLRLDVEHRQVVECCSCALRFPVTSLDVDGHDIVAGSEREAVNVLRFSPGDGHDRLEVLHSARFGVSAADARFLAPGLVAGVDRSGYVFVVGIPEGPSEFALDFVLGFHLGTECTRLRVGRLVRRLHGSRHTLPWAAPSSGALGCQQPPPESLVVTTIDGAVWTVVRITDDALVLLRLLEQAMLHMPLLHPARPLFAPGGATTRARGAGRIPPANVVDGALAAVFADALTEAEQVQVVDSSPDLGRMAREMAARDGGLGTGGAAPEASASAARFISGLVHALARTGAC